MDLPANRVATSPSKATSEKAPRCVCTCLGRSGRTPSCERCGIGRTEGVGHTKILIVEDDDELRELATQLVEGLGYGACSASSGAEAIAMVERDPKIGLLFTESSCRGA